jgi:hemolysin activation/secretion protein
VVSVKEGKSADVRIGIDNHGSRATGEERATANLRFNNLTQRGDTALVNLLKSDGLEYLGLGYELPFTAQGWRFEARAAHSNYHLGEEFESAEMRGPTRNLGIGLVVPLVRSAHHSVNFQTSYDANKYENSALGNVISKYRTNMVGAQVDGQHTDRGSRGQTQWVLQAIRGELDLSESPASYQLADESTTQTEGYFNKARVSITRRDWINPRNVLTASAQAQWSNKNLDGSEKFYLGGARGVRAYPVNEAGGSLGHLSSLEWETVLFQGPLGRWSMAGFYDHGKIRLYEDTARINLSKPNEYALHGYGLWVGTQAKLFSGTLGFRLTVAQRLGDNPGANADGLDSDGKRILNRIRLDANVNF